MEAAKKSVLLITILFLCSGSLTAGPTPANIFGTVQSKDGSSVPGVVVEATSPRLAGKATAVTNENGSFTLLGLAPGVYKLTFVMDGYKTVVRKNVALGLEQTRFLKITMKPGKSENDAAISNRAPHINVKGTTMGKNFTQEVRQAFPEGRNAANDKILTKEVFQTLPRGRNFDSLVTVFPGVSSEVLLLGGISIDGASGLENSYAIDGADTTSILDGSSGQNVSYDFVDDVQVRTSGFNAEFAGSLGGVINVVTRSGGNEFHGEIIGYYSGAPLRTKSRDILDLDINDDSKAVYYPYDMYYGVDDDQKFEGGFNLGGYILKDRLWFFDSLIPGYYANTRTTTYWSENARDWQRTEKQMNFLVKLNAQPFRNLRLGASLVNNFYAYKGNLSNSFANPYPYFSYDDYGFSYPNISGSFNADLTLGDSLLISARAGYFRTNQNDQLVQPSAEPFAQFLTEAPGGYFKTTNIGLLDIPVEYQKPTSQPPPRPSGLVMKRNIAEKLSLGADLSYFVNFYGEHSFKTGFSWGRRGQDVDNTFDVPILFFAWNRDFVAYGVNYGRGEYGYYAVRNNDVTGPYGDFYKAYSNMLALYLQDSWTIAKRLTVNFGVRAESEYIPSYATGNPDFENWKPIRFDLGDKIAPRLGFAWDVKSDSSLKVFGSYGIYHDDMKLKMAAAAFGGSKWKSTYYSLDTYKWPEIGVNNYFPGRPLLPAPYTFNFLVPALDTIDPDLKPMAQREISLGLEKRMRDDLSLSIRYVSKHLIRAIENVGILLPEGEKYYITNPGSTFINEKYADARAAGLIPQAAPDCPKAKREYNAVSIALDKRFAANWLGGISYTFSSLRGNYSGLASGDELGRTDPYTKSYFDSWYVSRKLDLTVSEGPLPGDRPHYVKAYGSYSFPFGVTTGMVLQAMSGTPTSTEWVMGHRYVPYGSMEYPGYMPFGRGDQKRAPFLWFANVYVEYNLKLGKNILNINLNVDNVFDVKTAQRIYPIYNQGSVAISDARIAQGPWDINDYEPELDPRYLMEADLYGPLTARVGVKFGF